MVRAALSSETQAEPQPIEGLPHAFHLSAKDDLGSRPDR
jgi:hypothetical protein